jgi:hypothetical protein
MARISLKDAEPGMVLAGDVVAAGDRLLLRSGNVLTLAHLRTFTMWAVADIDISDVTRQDVERRAADGLDAATRDAIERHLDVLFRGAERAHPLIDELLHVARLRLYRRAPRAGDGT